MRLGEQRIITDSWGDDLVIVRPPHRPKEIVIKIDQEANEGEIILDQAGIIQLIQTLTEGLKSFKGPKTRQELYEQLEGSNDEDI